jgi:hypothetical protein
MGREKEKSKEEKEKSGGEMLKAYELIGQKRKDRIESIFQLMEWDALTMRQLNYIESFERQFKAKGNLSDLQCETLENIFQEAAENA